MSVQLNMLCLICINRQYPQIALNLTMTISIFNFCSKYCVKQGQYLTPMVSPDKIQHDLNTFCLDNHRQSFWQLINRWVQCVLTYQSQWVDQNLLQLTSVWNFVTTPSAATLTTLNNLQELDSDCSAAIFMAQWTQAHWNAGRPKRPCGVNGVQAWCSAGQWTMKSFEIWRIADNKPCSNTFLQ